MKKKDNGIEKLTTQKKLYLIFFSILGVLILIYGVIRLDTGETYTVTITDKTAVPGSAGNAKVIIGDLNGTLITIPYDWNATTKIGSKLPVRKLSRLGGFWPTYSAILLKPTSP